MTIKQASEYLGITETECRQLFAGLVALKYLVRQEQPAEPGKKGKSPGLYFRRVAGFSLDWLPTLANTLVGTTVAAG